MTTATHGRHFTVPELVSEGKFVTVLAPMVRYSRLPFRLLCRRHGTDFAYSPMLMAESFVRSARARDADLTTNEFDRPLIVQFASHDPVQFSEAVRLVTGQCDGVDLNAGCPETWVCKQGDGSALLDNPELVADMIRTAVMSIPGQGPPPVSVKMRIKRDIAKTVELARRAEHAGAAYVAVHGRTKSQPDSEPADFSAIAQVKSSVSIPVIANGGIGTPEQVRTAREQTHADGVMSAIGLLRNPALFSGCERTPPDCIHDFLSIVTSLGMPFVLAHRHLAWMTHLIHPSAERRRLFNSSVSLASDIDYLSEILPPPSEEAVRKINDPSAVWVV